MKLELDNNLFIFTIIIAVTRSPPKQKGTWKNEKQKLRLH